MCELLVNSQGFSIYFQFLSSCLLHKFVIHSAYFFKKVSSITINYFLPKTLALGVNSYSENLARLEQA